MAPLTNAKWEPVEATYCAWTGEFIEPGRRLPKDVLMMNGNIVGHVEQTDDAVYAWAYQPAIRRLGAFDSLSVARQAVEKIVGAVVAE